MEGQCAQGLTAPVSTQVHVGQRHLQSVGGLDGKNSASQGQELVLGLCGICHSDGPDVGQCFVAHRAVVGFIALGVEVGSYVVTPCQRAEDVHHSHLLTDHKAVSLCQCLAISRHRCVGCVVIALAADIQLCQHCHHQKQSQYAYLLTFHHTSILI